MGAVFLSGAAVPTAGSRLVGAEVEGAAWDEADLADVIFESCAFIDVTFNGASVGGARFNRCRVVRCGFAHADLQGATFERCAFVDPETRQGARFAFAKLEEATLRGCDLSHALFDGADLYAVRFEDCNLIGASFARASFHRAFGRSVVRSMVSFIDCNLELADLAGASLAQCDLTGSRLREADLTGANLDNACLARADLFQAIVDGANLSRADVRGAEVSGLDLRRLADHKDMVIGSDQRNRLLDAMGLDVRE